MATMESATLHKSSSTLMVWITVMLMFTGTSCQMGLLPCPKIKTVKMRKNQPHKSFFEPSETLSADAKSDLHNKSYKSAEGRAVKNISVEEWDCPRPGAKKYMPKNVRENIRKNMQKIKSSEKNAADSVHVQ